MIMQPQTVTFAAFAKSVRDKCGDMSVRLWFRDEENNWEKLVSESNFRKLKSLQHDKWVVWCTERDLPPVA
eukprot:m.52868 g.52868  ORF g.52868 m.52868 type:complete len:71 (+) comp13107_c1_seq1:340-552(+)